MIPRITIRRLSARALITAATGMTVVLTAIAAASDVRRLIQPAMIAATSGVAIPTVSLGDVTIGPDVIGPTSAVPSPTLAVAGSAAIAPATIASSSAVTAPVVSAGAVGIQLATIASTSTVRVPAVAAGAVGVVPATIASTAAVPAPAIAQGAVMVQPDTIASTAAVAVPTAAVQAFGFDSDAMAYFAAMTVQPNATIKSRINDLVVALKTNGLWSKIDRFSIFALQTQQQGLLCLRNPTKTASASNTPVFTPGRGFSGDGSISFVDFGEPWGFTGANFTLNSASLFVWCNQAASAGLQAQIGNTGAARSEIKVRQGTGNNTFIVNDTTGTAYTASGVSTGFRCINRADANTKRAYTNGNLITTATVAATALSTTNGCALRGTASYSDAGLALAGSGGNFNDAENSALFNLINTFLTAIGAN